jgi:Fe-S cluster assembly protein SufD
MSELSHSLAMGLAAHSAAVEVSQPRWLQQLRQRAGEQFRRTGLPGPGVERWKYTSLRLLERRGGGLGHVPATSPAAPDAPAAILAEVPRAFMVDGALARMEGFLPAGVTVVALDHVLGDDHAGVRAAVESLDFQGPGQGFTALNTAMLGPGLYIHVARGVDGGRLLLQWLSGAEEAGGLHNSRVCLLLEAGAKLDLVEQFEGGAGTDPALNLVVQCRLDEGSALRHTRLQQLSSAAVLVALAEVRQARESRYEHTGLDLGGGLVRHDFHAMLDGEGAACSLHSGCVTTGRRHIDNHLDIVHNSPACTSSQLFRGVLAGRSRAVFNGRVLVTEGADGSEARQSSAGLLLSPHAEIDAKPELEIHTDEVVASHGATVGQLDEDALFYLRSRGLDEPAARQVLTLAFCRSVVDALPCEHLRGALGDRLQAALAAEALARG